MQPKELLAPLKRVRTIIDDPERVVSVACSHPADIERPTFLATDPVPKLNRSTVSTTYVHILFPQVEFMAVKFRGHSFYILPAMCRLRLSKSICVLSLGAVQQTTLQLVRYLRRELKHCQRSITGSEQVKESDFQRKASVPTKPAAGPAASSVEGPKIQIQWKNPFRPQLDDLRSRKSPSPGFYKMSKSKLPQKEMGAWMIIRAYVANGLESAYLMDRVQGHSSGS
ncbi:hypothetical protein EDC04DRAFT_2609473 [Pisolithus marmoratus]|nr:hypothetical protein EDC04DRAFT_2609473 [Pisolithus marmoratus]